MPLAPALADRFNRTVDSIHQPVVSRSDYVLDVPASGLTSAQADKVDQWFRAIDLGYGDRVSLDASQAGSSGAAADIATIVGGYGLLMSRGAPATEGAVPAGYLRIVVSRSTASVPGCPDYSQPSQPNFTASTSSNYGCATNSALAAMIANPEDLVRGAEAPGADNAEIATRSIRAWRTTEPTSKQGLKRESTKGGN
ncbi:CpaD family pilus assembly protein [Sphingomonas montanisoli]|nr:CpaD family pilus assembly lipoprotein [Sphingomonas montanisoli]